MKLSKFKGKTLTVKSCEARNHGDNEGCVCDLIGTQVVIIKQYNSPYVGTASFHIEGSDKRVRLSECGEVNEFN